MSLARYGRVITSNGGCNVSLRRRLSRLSATERANAPIDVHPEVEDALSSGRPIVSLETALVTHGVPYPTNLELGLELEGIVRSTGSIPATIGMIDGRIKIGLERSELERLADPQRKKVKISRRDIAPAIALKADGGTTCSATLIFSALAGIKVFSTGGLGGVHRGGETSMDISADLHELTRCSVGLVSAGVKSILDIGRTLEYLETLGVPVVSYGDTPDFPAFFSRKSGFAVPWNVNNPIHAAQILHSQRQLGLENGTFFAAPIPHEHESKGEAIQKLVEQAIAESEANGMSKRGKEVTPWLLSRVLELTKGESLGSNVALLRNTASIGSQIAIQYAKLASGYDHLSGSFTPALNAENETTASVSTINLASTNTPAAEDITLPPADLIIIGSVAVDITAQANADADATLATHSTAPGKVSLTMGGVARNVAEAAHRILTAQGLPTSSLLLAPVGEDGFGRLLVDETEKLGMRTDGLLKSDGRTAVCNMVLDSAGNLVGGVADMEITQSLADEQIVPQLRRHIPKIVAIDGNLSSATIKNIVSCCNQDNIKVFFEPTSVIKSTSVLLSVEALLANPDLAGPPIAFFSPNLPELLHIYNAIQAEPYNLSSSTYWWSCLDSMNLGSAFRMDLEQLAKRNVTDLDVSKGTLSFLIDQGIAQMAINLLPLFQHLIIKCGERGAIIAMRIDPKDATASPWGRERSNPQGRYIVAQGNNKEIIVLQHFPGLAVENVANVTGAGDSFAGAVLASLSQNPQAFYSPKDLEQTITAAQQAAVLTLQSELAVSPLLSDVLKLQSSAI
ncbi:indigoidine synthase A-like protein [Macrolepiota fuliginosa MF-IS2]|uniref:Indigoidine synthase A-like protein n=1 Tax=Macrolepiota fuliginosa MF-IS2 TaxID=1400762 RepID=A0A9P5XQC0_9AGAR|nr:indigoidine synthase A-like protein [Macrolepiota fuliginosa MF-IS2]